MRLELVKNGPIAVGLVMGCKHLLYYRQGVYYSTGLKDSMDTFAPFDPFEVRSEMHSLHSETPNNKLTPMSVISAHLLEVQQCPCSGARMH